MAVGPVAAAVAISLAAAIPADAALGVFVGGAFPAGGVALEAAPGLCGFFVGFAGFALALYQRAGGGFGSGASRAGHPFGCSLRLAFRGFSVNEIGRASCRERV